MNTAPPRSDDDASLRPDAPDSARSDRPRKPPPPDSRTCDEISFLLSSSLERPEPDPMLGGSSSVDLQQDLRGGAAPRHAEEGLDFDVRVAPPSDEVPALPPTPARSDLWNVVLKSYASAVTLALIWVLWTGRTARPPEATAPQRDPASVRRRAAEVEPPAASEDLEPPSAVKSTPLRKPIVLGDLEITPLTVLRKGVQASRRQEGNATRVVNERGCLVLTLRIKNTGTVDTLTPLAAQDLWNLASFGIDSPPGASIAMYTTGSRAEWTIDDQAFPAIKPGAVEDVTLVSEPVTDSRLSTSMIWRFRVATAPDRSQKTDVAVRFNRDDVHEGG